MRFALPIVPPSPRVEDALENVRGLPIRYVTEDTRAGQRVVRYEVAGSKVDLLQDPAFRTTAITCIDGPDALDVALVLAESYAFLPAELIAARVRSNTDASQRLAALVLLAQVTALGTLPVFLRIAIASVGQALRDSDVSVRQFARAVEDGLPETAEGLSPSRTPRLLVVPDAPLEAMVARLKPAFARERSGDAWIVHDLAGRDGHVRLEHDDALGLTFAQFTGSAAAAFAYDLMHAFHYLPTELVTEAASSMSDLAGRRRMAAALGQIGVPGA